MEGTVVPARVPIEMELVDPACVPDVFVEGIADIQRIAGDCLRVTLYSTRIGADGLLEQIVVARVVWPVAVAAAVNAQCRAFLETGQLLLADMPPGIVPS